MMKSYVKKRSIMFLAVQMGMTQVVTGDVVESKSVMERQVARV